MDFMTKPQEDIVRYCLKVWYLSIVSNVVSFFSSREMRLKTSKTVMDDASRLRLSKTTSAVHQHFVCLLFVTNDFTNAAWQPLHSCDILIASVAVSIIIVQSTETNQLYKGRDYDSCYYLWDFASCSFQFESRNTPIPLARIFLD